MYKFKYFLAITLFAFSFISFSVDLSKPRARDLGVPFDGTPGEHNAITDVAGVEVGYATLIEDKVAGTTTSAVRTGVTAIHPRGKSANDPVFAGWFPLNGNGDMTGTHWIDESGWLEGPVVITNTHSVGVVRDAVIDWQSRHGGFANTEWSLPVVAETYDGYLNDINGFHVEKRHAFQALDTAKSGPVAEGNVGGGVGMMCYEFKCGTGTSSRVIAAKHGGFTVGVLVQANHGLRYQLQIAGVPIGRMITENAPWSKGDDLGNEVGSIIIVVATDAPLLPHQLKRLARRAAMGLARTGSVAGNGSGDIFIAFSTSALGAYKTKGVSQISMLSNDSINPIFRATVQAVEEAIINAIVAGETMSGVEGHRVFQIPHDRLKHGLAQYNRLNKSENAK